jgi:hypothetical protein
MHNNNNKINKMMVVAGEKTKMGTIFHPEDRRCLCYSFAK